MGLMLLWVYDAFVGVHAFAYGCDAFMGVRFSWHSLAKMKWDLLVLF